MYVFASICLRISKCRSNVGIWSFLLSEVTVKSSDSSPAVEQVPGSSLFDEFFTLLQNKPAITTASTQPIRQWKTSWSDCLSDKGYFSLRKRIKKVFSQAASFAPACSIHPIEILVFRASWQLACRFPPWGVSIAPFSASYWCISDVGPGPCDESTYV